MNPGPEPGHGDVPIPVTEFRLEQWLPKRLVHARAHPLSNPGVRRCALQSPVVRLETEIRESRGKAQSMREQQRRKLEDADWRIELVRLSTDKRARFRPWPHELLAET